MKLIFLFVISLIIHFSVKGQDDQLHQVNSTEFKSIIESVPGILLDVRTNHEFKNGHIKNSDQLNYYSFDFRKKLLSLPKDQPVYLYCNTGYRSEKAAKTLIKNGYTNIYNLQHGIMEWELHEYSVTIEPDANPDLINKFRMKDYLDLIQSDSLVFIDFYAPWCGPCRKMMPMIDSLKIEYHNSINIVKINADASKKLIKELKIIAVPQLYLYKNGQLIYSRDEFTTRQELVDLFRSVLLSY